ncbi:hypothetical protein RF11_00176 [Thelohanellus kitauei]|uniref:Uncharacterized protein n=1 Tax=Thelohanellus kitauei TaxID=669202 RepID=A0A0C2MSX3_THEKT|nr:hypothetical protein RF11_00176 [Thelohanellus kitauei]
MLKVYANQNSNILLEQITKFDLAISNQSEKAGRYFQRVSFWIFDPPSTSETKWIVWDMKNPLIIEDPAYQITSVSEVCPKFSGNLYCSIERILVVNYHTIPPIT